jgi:nitrous oxidase accessory protein NosD
MRRAIVLLAVIACGAAAAAAVTAARDGAERDALPDALPSDAVRVADRFMRALVIERRSPHISLSIGVVEDDVHAWTSFLQREGIDTIVRGGEVQERCEVPFPIFAPARRMSGACVVYAVRGRVTARPRGPAVITARMRIWLIKRGGAWQVAELDFSPQNGFRSTSKAFYVDGY